VVGPIDIMAVDGSGAFFVLDLKWARVPVHMIGLLIRYIDLVKQKIGEDREVNGIIVSREMSENLSYVEFYIEPANDVPRGLTAVG